MMHTKAMMKYSLLNSLKIVSPFYLTLIGIIILFIAISNSVARNGSLGGWDALALLATCGLATCFKERFHFFIQNGFSRKTLFFNFLLCFTIGALAISAFDMMMTLINQAGIIVYHSFFSMLYEGSVPTLWMDFLWHITLQFATLSTAFFFTIIFYRLNKLARIILFLVVPTILLVGCPIVDLLFPDIAIMAKLLELMFRFFGLFGTIDPFSAILNFSILAILAMIASYFALQKLDVAKG